MAEPEPFDEHALEERLAEHLYLSSCIERGTFDPVADGLSAEDFPAARDVFKWFEQYASSGPERPVPPVALVRRLHPSFVYVEGVDRRWARDRLHENTGLNRMLGIATGIVRRVEEGEGFEDVWTWARASIDAVPMSGGSTGIDMLQMRERPQRTSLPTVYRQIERAGGISAGNFVVIAGRPGDGKSWRLAQHAFAAAVGGRSVVYYSLEMNSYDVLDRICFIALGRRSQQMTQEERLEEMARMIPEGGRITIKDQTFGNCSPASVARDIGGGEVAIIDYVGLMSSGTDTRGASLAETAKSITNALRNISQNKQAVIIAGAQLNRTAAGGAEYGVEALAQTDALGQDADMVVALRRPAEGVTSNQIIKARHGASGMKWFTRFDPMGDGFDEIEASEAWRMIGG